MMQLITEGKAKIRVPATEKISKDMPVFYNPAMKLNRDFTVALLNAHGSKMQIADPFAGTGVRSIRLALELKKSIVKSICANDCSPDAVKLIKANLKLNKVKAEVSCMDASQFLLKSCGFDYIDIDPFGYPGRFISAAAERISRHGILAVTATDTSALSGTFPGACLRKYWAVPLRCELMHELGLRILIRHCQLIGEQYEKLFIPIASYSTLHYMRAFFSVEKAKDTEAIYGEHGYVIHCSKCSYHAAVKEPFSQACPICKSKVSYAGPLWLGPLGDPALLSKMKMEFSSQLAVEYEQNVIGFYDIHRVCEVYKLKIPRMEFIFEALRKKGYRVSRTHFSPLGIKTDADIGDFVSSLS